MGLRVANSNPGGISVSLAALTSFTHNVTLDPGATLDLGSSNFTFGPAVPTTGLGLISGSGTISSTGSITMTAGTTVMPGLNGIGTLTVGNITLNGTLQLDTMNTPTNDILAVNGTLTLGAGSTLILPNTNTYTSASIDYTLATFSGLTGTFGTVTGAPAGFQVVYGTNSITLHNNSIVTKYLERQPQRSLGRRRHCELERPIHLCQWERSCLRRHRQRTQLHGHRHRRQRGSWVDHR